MNRKMTIPEVDVPLLMDALEYYAEHLEMVKQNVDEMYSLLDVFYSSENADDGLEPPNPCDL